jgi:hypothetical protein
MMAKMTTILVPFLSFATIYIPSYTHNMFMLMLDLRFKCLDVGQKFCGMGKSYGDGSKV